MKNLFDKKKLDRSTKLYIDENQNIYEGTKAAKHLKRNNDSKFYDNGVLQVPKERWNTAQAAEKNTWMNVSINAKSDRNLEHASNFNNYSCLKNKIFDNVIEIGCGQFTNIRIISQYCTIVKCDLCDPLINSYLKHKWCYYKNGELNKIPVKTIAEPAEELKNYIQYGMVVLVNVLEHCYDARKALANAYNICKKGGYFVFHDRIYDRLNIKKELTNIYDAAHPIRVDNDLTNEYLAKFEPVFENRLCTPVPLLKIDREAIYFIGKKI